MTEGITAGLELIRLPIDQAFWQAILKTEGVREKLSGDSRVLLIGTDPDLTLAKQILATYPQAQITIVERNQKIVEAVQKKVPDQVKLIAGDFLGLEESVLPKASLVAAKHLIHFPGVDLKAIVGRATAIGEQFFASVPPVVHFLVDRNLHKNGIEFRKTSLGQAGEMYCFKS